MDKEERITRKIRRELWQILTAKLDFQQDPQQYREWANQNYTLDLKMKKKAYSILKYKLTIIFVVFQLTYLPSGSQLHTQQKIEFLSRTYMNIANLFGALATLLICPATAFYYLYSFCSQVFPKILLLLQCFFFLQLKDRAKICIKNPLLHLKQFVINLSVIVSLLGIYQAIKPYLLVGEKSLVLVSCIIFFVNCNRSKEHNLSILSMIPLSADESLLKGVIIILILAYTRAGNQSEAKGCMRKNKGYSQILERKKWRRIVIFQIIVMLCNRQFSLLLGMAICLMSIELIRILDGFARILKYERIKNILKLQNGQSLCSKNRYPSEQNWEIHLPIPEYN